MDPLTLYLTHMTKGVIHLLNSGKGYQDQSKKTKGECSRSRKVSRGQAVSEDGDENVDKLTPVNKKR